MAITGSISSGKHHLLHVVDVGEDHAGGAVEGFGEEAVHDHADEHHHGKAGVAFFAAIAPARLEDDRKNEGVDGQHQQGREERPGQAHERSLVAAEHFAPGHLQDELAVAPEALAQGRGGCGLGGVGVHWRRCPCSRIPLRMRKAMMSSKVEMTYSASAMTRFSLSIRRLASSG
jgi:hypothetical protein